MVEMKEDLEGVFQRKVDLLSKKGVERGKNKLRKEEILNSARVIYVKAA